MHELCLPGDAPELKTKTKVPAPENLPDGTTVVLPAFNRL